MLNNLWLNYIRKAHKSNSNILASKKKTKHCWICYFFYQAKRQESSILRLIWWMNYKQIPEKELIYYRIFQAIRHIFTRFIGK